MNTPHARFFVGQVVHHRLYDYRGVVVDVDAVFNPAAVHDQAETVDPARDEPWYHVLVDGATHSAYVAEHQLEVDASGLQVEHPQVAQYFDGFRDGSYHARHGLN